MRILNLFDGCGLSRLGLEMAGHKVLGIELDPWKHYLSQFIGSGNCILGDATEVDISGFDAIWASPPCQLRSSARTQGPPVSEFSKDYLEWSLNLPSEILWVENVTVQNKGGNDWGIVWNAAQFLEHPVQNRNRVIGGRYRFPKVYHNYKKTFAGICPSVLASEHKGSACDTRRASRFYGRKLTIEECAFHQGLDKIPEKWLEIPKDWPYTKTQWTYNIYQGIGNAVPTYMSRAFGEAYQ